MKLNCLMLVICCLTLTACGSDDETQNNTPQFEDQNADLVASDNLVLSTACTDTTVTLGLNQSAQVEFFQRGNQLFFTRFEYDNLSCSGAPSDTIRDDARLTGRNIQLENGITTEVLDYEDGTALEYFVRDNNSAFIYFDTNGFEVIQFFR